MERYITILVTVNCSITKLLVIVHKIVICFTIRFLKHTHRDTHVCIQNNQPKIHYSIENNYLCPDCGKTVKQQVV